MLRKVNELTEKNANTTLARVFLKAKRNKELKEQQKEWREKASENSRKFFEEK